MKNLKRIVALALAFVMTFTLSFAFNDAESIGIDYVDDVNMLVQLGVINGYTDGSFKPQDSVSRAEFAKMAYTLKYGYDDQGKLFGGSASTFVDVADNHWAKGYINYCANQKIVSGIGGGKFNPNGNVTVAEAAKMLLVILGCNAQTEGLVGVNWQGNTVAKAIELGVFDGWVGDPTAPASRELICKLMRNTIFAPVYIYSPITGVGSQKKVLEPSEDNITLGEQTMGLKHITGIVVANEFYGINVLDNDKEVIKASATNDEDKSIVAYENEEGKWVTEDINVGLSEEVLGSLVDVYYAYNKNTRQDEVIGDVLINSNTVVYEVPASEIDIYPNGEETRSKKEIKPYIAFGDVEIAAPVDTKRVSEAKEYNGEAFASFTYVFDVINGKNCYSLSSITDNETYLGLEDMGKNILKSYRIISLDGGKSISYIFETKKAELSAVSSYSETKGVIGLRSFGSIELDDAVVYDGIRKGDNVIVYEFDGKTVVEPTETVTGIATTWSKNTVVINGDTYTGSDDFLTKNKVKSLSEYFGNIVRRNTSYIVYNGMILDTDKDVEVEIDTSNYAVVLKSEADEKTGEATVRLGMTDGSDEVYTVSYFVDADGKAHDAEDEDLSVLFADNKLFGNIVSYNVRNGKVEIDAPRGTDGAFVAGEYAIKDEGIKTDKQYWSDDNSVIFLLYTSSDTSRTVRFKTYKLADMSDRTTAATPIYNGVEKVEMNGVSILAEDNIVLLGAITCGVGTPALLSEGEDVGYIVNSVVVYDTETRKNYLDVTVIGKDGAITGSFKDFKAAEINGLAAGDDVESGEYAIGNIVTYAYDDEFKAIDDISDKFVKAIVTDVTRTRISYYTEIGGELQVDKFDEYRFESIAMMDDEFIGEDIYECDCEKEDITNDCFNAYIQLNDDGEVIRVFSIHE